MADNVTLNAGSGGDTVATEDIGGVEYQKVKLVDGTATSTTAIPLSGDLTNGLDVDVTRVGGTVTVDGSGVTQPVSNTAIDNAHSADFDSGAGTDTTSAFGIAVPASGGAAVIPGDATAGLKVDLGADNDVTVTGTVTVDLGANNDVTIEGGAVLGTTGSAGPANAISVGGTESGGTFRELAVDSSGNLQVDIVSGGGTQYAEDSVHTTGDTGTMALAVRNDTLAALAGTDGDYSALQVNANGALYVNVENITSTLTDDAAFTPASGEGLAAFAMFDDVTPDSVDEGDAGILRMSANRNLYSTIRDAAGNERGANVNASNEMLVKATDSDALLTTIDADTSTIAGAVAGTEMQVDVVTSALPTGAATAANQTTGNTSLGNIETAVQLIDNSIKADDAAFTLASDSVNMAGAIRDDTLSALTAIEGDAVPLRVNSTGALHVTGAGGGTQYTVDDPNPTTVTMAGVVRDDTLTTLTEADGDASVLRVSSTGALHVTGGGGGTEYTEDVATPNPIVGTSTVMERDDALSALTPIEGDWAAMRCSAEGALWTQDFNSDAILADTNTLAGAVAAGQMQVDIVADGAGLATAANQSTGNTSLSNIETATQLIDDAIYADDADWTDSTSKHMLVGGLYQSVPQTVTDGDVAPLQVDSNGNVIEANSAAILADTASMDTNLGTLAGAVSGAQFQVDIAADSTAGLATSALQATVNTNTTDIPNVIGTDGAAGPTKALSIGGTDGSGNLQEISVDTDGQLQVDIATIAAGDNNIGNVDIVTLPASTNTIEVVGDVAHDIAAAGNPVLGAARATNSIEGLTQVAAADASYITSDLNGCLVTRAHTTLEENISERVSDTAGTSTNFTNFAAGGAGIHNYVTDVTITNTSATDTYVDLRDGSAGSVIWTFPCPANGGATHSFSVPLKGAANTALAYDVGAAASTVYISVNGFQAQG